MPVEGPPFWGLWPAVVADNVDPLGLYRVKFVCAALMDDKVMEWAKPMGMLFGGGGSRRADGTVDPCGFAGVPNVGASIMVSFVGGDLSFPYFISGWFAEDSEDAAKNDVPVSPSQSSPKGSPLLKMFETAKWRMFFDDNGAFPNWRIERKGDETINIRIDGLTNVIEIVSKPSAGSEEARITMDGASGTITIEGSTKIDLGASALDALIKGTAFKTFFDAHFHPDPVSGVTGPPTVAMDTPPGTHLSAKVNTE